MYTFTYKVRWCKTRNKTLLKVRTAPSTKIEHVLCDVSKLSTIRLFKKWCKHSKANCLSISKMALLFQQVTSFLNYCSACVVYLDGLWQRAQSAGSINFSPKPALENLRKCNVKPSNSQSDSAQRPISMCLCGPDKRERVWHLPYCVIHQSWQVTYLLSA